MILNNNELSSYEEVRELLLEAHLQPEDLDTWLEHYSGDTGFYACHYDENKKLDGLMSVSVEKDGPMVMRTLSRTNRPSDLRDMLDYVEAIVAESKYGCLYYRVPKSTIMLAVYLEDRGYKRVAENKSMFKMRKEFK